MDVRQVMFLQSSQGHRNFLEKYYVPMLKDEDKLLCCAIAAVPGVELSSSAPENPKEGNYWGKAVMGWDGMGETHG